MNFNRNQLHLFLWIMLLLCVRSRPSVPPYNAIKSAHLLQKNKADTSVDGTSHQVDINNNNNNKGNNNER